MSCRTTSTTAAPTPASTFSASIPETAGAGEDLSDDDIMYLNRVGTTPIRFTPPTPLRCERQRPTVILAMTVKGYGTGEAGEANNETHSLKKLDMESLKAFRDRFAIPS